MAGRQTNRVAVACLSVMLLFAVSPLLQAASAEEVLETRIANGEDTSTDFLSSKFTSVIRSFNNRSAISLAYAGCEGSCQGVITAPGLDLQCNTTFEPYNMVAINDTVKFLGLNDIISERPNRNSEFVTYDGILRRIATATDALYRSNISITNYINGAYTLYVFTLVASGTLAYSHVVVRDPGPDIYNGIRDIFFRSAVVVYRSRYGFLAGVLSLSSVCIVATSILFDGWWELGRRPDDYALSPVEMARAFAAPLLVFPGADDDNSNFPVKEVLKRIGRTPVRYGVVVVAAEPEPKPERPTNPKIEVEGDVEGDSAPQETVQVETPEQTQQGDEMVTIEGGDTVQEGKADGVQQNGTNTVSAEDEIENIGVLSPEKPGVVQPMGHRRLMIADPAGVSLPVAGEQYY
ncbi:hypothetical protein B0T16DRAFT_491449 [Cercophora newfieldiana]|uniref:Uncharacterized protein n=1 Tax=Cercophora newfieldiana TaxID=92897 RepID=A0AA39Y9U2_9PEZI|nr:hypothetical protein B0T16DRAFT_491449 [Cercophora newfieldiana]